MSFGASRRGASGPARALHWLSLQQHATAPRKDPPQVMTLRRRTDLVERDLGPEMILYDPGRETFHVLNGSARRIWLMIDGGRDEDAMTREYARLHASVDPSSLGGDLRRALEEFVRAGLVERS